MKAQYLTEKQVSEMTGRALQTLRNERHLCRGIPYVKVGRSIRYSLEDVIGFMETRKVRTQDSPYTPLERGRQARVATRI
ncbi:MAG: helix-turn-helix domain-containing protein [bacterium]